MSGNPLEFKLPLIIKKFIIIGRVMTSLKVKTFKIGQSAGKVSKSVMIRTRYSLNYRTDMDLRSLINFDDNLRYSLVSIRNYRVVKRFHPINKD
jgi:hypothetical protein